MALLLDATPEPEPAADTAASGWLPRSVPSALTMVGDAVADQLDKALALARMPLGWLRDPGSLRDGPGAGVARRAGRRRTPRSRSRPRAASTAR